MEAAVTCAPSERARPPWRHHLTPAMAALCAAVHAKARSTGWSLGVPSAAARRTTPSAASPRGVCSPRRPDRMEREPGRRPVGAWLSTGKGHGHDISRCCSSIPVCGKRAGTQARAVPGMFVPGVEGNGKRERCSQARLCQLSLVTAHVSRGHDCQPSTSTAARSRCGRGHQSCTGQPSRDVRRLAAALCGAGFRAGRCSGRGYSSASGPSSLDCRPRRPTHGCH
jgi:hypothetical protein